MNDSEQWKQIHKEWSDFHIDLYLPGSAINTETIYQWWLEKTLALLAQQKTLAREGGRKEVDSLWRLAIGHLNSSAREKILLTKRLLEEARPKEGGK